MIGILCLFLLILLIYILYLKNKIRVSSTGKSCEEVKKFKISREEYETSNYFKLTNLSYFDINEGCNKGRLGEYFIYKNLKDFENNNSKFLFNVCLSINNMPKEIDVILLCTKGIFVFESKNHMPCVILPNQKDAKKDWNSYVYLKKVSDKKRNNWFKNPVEQNNFHIEYLKNMFGMQIPMWSIIAFSNKCNLEKVKEFQNDYIKIVNYNMLSDLISDIYNNFDDYMTEKQVLDIYKELYNRQYWKLDKDKKKEYEFLEKNNN